MLGWLFEVFGAITDWASTALGSREIEPPLTGAMRAFLMDDTDIASVITSASDQIRPLRLPQKPKFPCIVLNRISAVRGAHLRGINALARTRYQLDCYDPSLDVAVRLGSYCARRLGGFSGRWTTTTSPAQSISVTVLPENEMDLFEDVTQGPLCRHSADYFLYHRVAS